MRILAVGFLPLGILLTLADAWLSMQSVVGILGIGTLNLIVGIVVGGGLSAFLVFAALVGMSETGIAMKALWGVFLIVDLSTSLTGAIWYGALRSPYTEPIDFSKLTVAPEAVPRLVIFSIFTAIVTISAILLGKTARFLLS
jgi:hypothetical protein